MTLFLQKDAAQYGKISSTWWIFVIDTSIKTSLKAGSSCVILVFTSCAGKSKIDGVELLQQKWRLGVNWPASGDGQAVASQQRHYGGAAAGHSTPAQVHQRHPSPQPQQTPEWKCGCFSELGRLYSELPQWEILVMKRYKCGHTLSSMEALAS